MLYLFKIYEKKKSCTFKRSTSTSWKGAKRVSHSIHLHDTSRKPVRCTKKLLKIKSKLILILFTSFVEYGFFFFFLLVQNVVGKIDKETLRIEFKINPTF